MDTHQQNLLPILAIDTSTQFLSLAVQTEQGDCLYHEEVGSKQSEFILPTIQDLLSECNLNLDALSSIVYAKGPGTFTGLRIGLGVAQGLALPHQIKLIGVPTLDAIAQLVAGRRYVLAAIDARMGELFYAWYDIHSQKRLTPYHVGKAAEIEIPAEVDLDDAIGIGNAYDLNIQMPLEGIANMPTALDYIYTASTTQYEDCSIADSQILYVRDKIALTAKEQAEQKAQKQ